MMFVLEIQDICKTYGKGQNEVKALQHIDLKIEQGSFVAIVGKSGSGKSTLLHLMGGLDHPDCGEIILNQTNYSSLNDKEMTLLRRRKIGFVFQFFNLIPSQNVYENIVLPIRIDGLYEDQSFVNDVIDLLGLTDKKLCYIDELSGGQQQRVAIARALASKPEMILLDEPTGNLDSQNSQEVMELLRLSQKKYQQTIVMVTHDALMANQSQRIITLEDGKIVGDYHV